MYTSSCYTICAGKAVLMLILKEILVYLQTRNKMPRVIKSVLKKGNQLANPYLTVLNTFRSNVIFSNLKLY